MSSVFLVFDLKLPHRPLVAVCQSFAAAMSWPFADCPPQFRFVGSDYNQRWEVTGYVNACERKVLIVHREASPVMPDWEADARIARRYPFVI